MAVIKKIVFMPKKQLTILADDDIKAWVDLPRGRIEVRINGRLVYEEFNGKS